MLAEAARIRGAEHAIAEKFKWERSRRPKCGCEFLHQPVPHAGPPRRHHSERLRFIRAREVVELAGQFGDCLIPGDLFELAVAFRARALERMPDAIRVIRDFDGRLPARAELALADRVLRISFELLRELHLYDAGLA